jgi:hypothetical protein
MPNRASKAVNLSLIGYVTVESAPFILFAIIPKNPGSYYSTFYVSS